MVYNVNERDYWLYKLMGRIRWRWHRLIYPNCVDCLALKKRKAMSNVTCVRSTTAWSWPWVRVWGWILFVCLLVFVAGYFAGEFDGKRAADQWWKSENVTMCIGPTCITCTIRDGLEGKCGGIKP